MLNQADNPDPSSNDTETPAAPIHPLDAQAIDAVLQEYWDQTPPPEWIDPGRLEAARNWLAMIEQGVSADLPDAELSDRLIETTLDRVRRQRELEWVVGQIEPTPEPPKHAIAFRWNDLIGVAAVLLLGVSLVWPLLSQARQDARRIACSNQLATAGIGFGRYALDFAGILPRHQTEVGNPWSRVGAGPNRQGQVQSNSANLVLAVRTGYMFSDVLACPGNPDALRHLPEWAWDYPSLASISYSYQSQFTILPQRLDAAPRIIILADKNPLLGFGPGQRMVFIAERERQSPTAMHNFVGQNALHADGSVSWMRTPVTPDGDNIWLPEGRQEFRTFRETPAHDRDIMLIP